MTLNIIPPPAIAWIYMAAALILAVGIGAAIDRLYLHRRFRGANRNSVTTVRVAVQPAQIARRPSKYSRQQ
ncbi:MAG: hypothetical protein K1V81_01900 [Paramuribaculum sp.]|jgi:hypothetical protein